MQVLKRLKLPVNLHWTILVGLKWNLNYGTLDKKASVRL